MKSQQAQVAALIKKYLKEMGIKCRTRSDSFSMGNSVDVTIFDQPPDIKKKIDEETAKYQYGHFNGMEDIYEYSNRRHDIPQTKYLSIDNSFSDEIKQTAWSYIHAHFRGADEYPEKLEDVPNGARVFDEWHTTIIWRLLNGSMDEQSKEFWANYTKKSTPRAQKPPESNNGQGITVSINKEKNGVEIRFPGIPAEEIRNELKSHNWRWSRFNKCWYNRHTPENLAFANGFLNKEISTEQKTAPKEKPATIKEVVKKDHSKKLRALADGLTDKIQNKLADRLTNTPKRLKQANYARLEGEKLQRTQQALYALAGLHEAGTVPAILEKFTTKATIYDLMGTKKEPVSNGYHGYHVCTGEPYHDTEESRALWALISRKSEEDKKADEIRRKEEGLQFSNIPGFFPTPPEVAEKMVEYADIESGMTVLEPSAGKGDIIKALNGSFVRIKAIEYNHMLSEILKDKFPMITVENEDFLACNGNLGKFDRIIMNPPFDKWADIKHINHARGFLRPGGKLVALCANGPKQQEALQGIADHWEVLPGQSFKQSGTNVNVALLVITA